MDHCLQRHRVLVRSCAPIHTAKKSPRTTQYCPDGTMSIEPIEMVERALARARPTTGHTLLCVLFVRSVSM